MTRQQTTAEYHAWTRKQSEAAALAQRQQQSFLAGYGAYIRWRAYEGIARATLYPARVLTSDEIATRDLLDSIKPEPNPIIGPYSDGMRAAYADRLQGYRVRDWREWRHAALGGDA